jgi:hypothetical protein
MKKILKAYTIEESTMSPQMVIIIEEDGIFMEYDHVTITHELIQELKYMGEDDIIDLILDKEFKLVSVYYLFEKYTSLRYHLKPYLRDKIIDNIIGNSTR